MGGSPQWRYRHNTCQLRQQSLPVTTANSCTREGEAGFYLGAKTSHVFQQGSQKIALIHTPTVATAIASVWNVTYSCRKATFVRAHISEKKLRAIILHHAVPCCSDREGEAALNCSAQFQRIDSPPPPVDLHFARLPAPSPSQGC